MGDAGRLTDLHDVRKERRGHEADGNVHHLEKGGALDDVKSAIAAERHGADGKGFGADLVPECTGLEVELEVADEGEIEEVGPPGARKKVIQHKV